jgi:hypothetical protein
MPKRIPVKSVIIQRDGKQKRLQIGTEFDFTADELKDIEASSPNSLRKIVIEDKLLAQQAAATEEEEKAKAVAAAEKAKDEKAKADAAAEKGNVTPKPAAKTSAADL